MILAVCVLLLRLFAPSFYNWDLSAFFDPHPAPLFTLNLCVLWQVFIFFYFYFGYVESFMLFLLRKDIIKSRYFLGDSL